MRENICWYLRGDRNQLEIFYKTHKSWMVLSVNDGGWWKTMIALKTVTCTGPGQGKCVCENNPLFVIRTMKVAGESGWCKQTEKVKMLTVGMFIYDANNNLWHPLSHSYKRSLLHKHMHSLAFTKIHVYIWIYTVHAHSIHNTPSMSFVLSKIANLVRGQNRPTETPSAFVVWKYLFVQELSEANRNRTTIIIIGYF